MEWIIEPDAERLSTLTRFSTINEAAFAWSGRR
jgi:hypothetical protein